MAKSNVNFRIDGLFVVATLAVGSAAYLFYQRKKVATIVTESLNPTHQENIVNQAAQSVLGKERLQNGFEVVFAFIDKANPFNESDAYADQVLDRAFGSDKSEGAKRTEDNQGFSEFGI